MRMSELFLRTLRDDPADADVESHRLLLRAGFIRRVSAGVYSWLPLGSRALRKTSEIVREEIDRKKLLLDSGLTNRSEYTALLRAEAELIGQVGSLQSQVASSSTQIIETKQQIERLTTSRVEDAVAELNTERATIADVEEQVQAFARRQLAALVLLLDPILSPTEERFLAQREQTVDFFALGQCVPLQLRRRK